MKEKRKILMLIVVCSVVCSVLITSPLTVSAATKDNLVSIGSFVFDNGTPDPSDDALFDYTDLILISDKIDKLAEGL